MTQKYLSIHCIIRLFYTTVKPDTRSSRRVRRFLTARLRGQLELQLKEKHHHEFPQLLRSNMQRSFLGRGSTERRGRQQGSAFVPGSPSAPPPARSALRSVPPARPGAARCRLHASWAVLPRLPPSPEPSPSETRHKYTWCYPYLKNNQLRFTYMWRYATQTQCSFEAATTWEHKSIKIHPSQ